MKRVTWFIAGALTASAIWLVYLTSIGDRLLCMMLRSGC